MNILHTLQHISRDRNLPLLIVGGHAVAVSGYQRSTSDLDIAVLQGHRATWREIMEGMGYTLFSDQLTFAQFHPPQPWEWPVDLMFLSEETFRKLASDGVNAVILGVEVRIPSPEHIIALKLHAIRYGPPRREAGDLVDILELIEANKIDIAGDRFRKLCNRYATPELYERIAKEIAKRKQ